MIQFLVDLLTVVFFPVELMVAVLLFTSRLEKRSYFPLRLAFMVVVGPLLPWVSTQVFLFLLTPLKIDFSLATLLIFSLTSYLVATGFIQICYRTSILEALYYATCAYLTQHFTYCLYVLLYPDTTTGMLPSNLWYFLIYGATYWAAWFFFARKLSREGWYQIDSQRAIGTTASALVISVVLSAVGQQMENIYRPLYTLVLIYSMVCCFYILWDQVGQQRQLILRHELGLQQQLWLQHKAQYELSAKTVELINRKCHDLKHQVAALKHISDQMERDRSIQELEKSVMVYDSMIKTGNEILDTVLTEKSLLCEVQGITLTCVADGSCLSFMDAVDIYTIFGNALDNAIESVSALEDVDQRSISVMVFSRANLVFLQLENYCDTPLQYEGDLPATSKKEEQGYHGFGLKSIRYIAEKYGGVLSIQCEDEIFLLQVTIPNY